MTRKELAAFKRTGLRIESRGNCAGGCATRDTQTNDTEDKDND